MFVGCFAKFQIVFSQLKDKLLYLKLQAANLPDFFQNFYEFLNIQSWNENFYWEVLF